MKVNTIAAQTKDNKVYIAVFNESVLALNKSDKLVFIINNETYNFNFTLVFDFDDQGEDFSSTFWETPETNTLVYLLHKWESPTWVEIGKSVELKGNNINGEYLLKFRSHSSETSSHRQFDVTVWRREPNAEK